MKRITKAEQRVIRAAMAVGKSFLFDGGILWLKGNKGSIAKLARACSALAASRKGKK